MNEESLFHQALGKPAAGRAGFLAAACGGDEDLRQRLQVLLQAHENPGGFLQQPAVTVDGPITEHPGMVVGPYTLLEQIGEGGMGLVFVAEQQQPVRRKVALKVIKPGMDTRQVVARFEAERQALALMEHPHIAKVIDGGETAGGRPYFAMELVKGMPITEYCDQNRVPIRERLELFAHVCQAVQHAHQKGIIHRDLKPSNVLVMSHDGTPVIKVIDFGVAKAIGQQLTDKTIYTQFAQLVGTPLYMAPEQAGESGLDVDTRSDIYALGVLLYELLTGTTPFDKERMKAASYEEMRRIIREEEPPKPSTRISTVGQLATTISMQRNSDPKRLRQLVRGELDWMVMKALEKDRNRRYETASAFAADVQRYLADEPVQACPPSAWYRFRKFGRRNRRALAVVGVILFFLVLLGGAGLWWAQQRAGAAGAAWAALEEATGLLKEERWPEAISAARRAEGVLAGVAADPELRQQVHELIRDLKMAERLQEASLQGSAARRYDRSHFEAPEAAYAAAFVEYGLDIEGPDAPAVAQEIRSRYIHTQLVAALDNWARVGKHLKRPGWRQRLAVARAADPDARRNRLRDTLEGEDPKALEEIAAAKVVDTWPASTIALLGTLAKGTAAEERVAAVLARAQQRHPSDFWINKVLGDLLSGARPPRLEEAIRYYTAAVALRPQSPNAHYGLANPLHGKGRLDEAIAEYREAIRLKKDFPEAHTNLGLALADQDRLDEAIAEYRLAIASRQEFPEAHIAHTNLGAALKRQGWRDEAIAAYREAIRLKKDYPEANYNLGNALLDLGRLDEAIAAYREAIKSKQPLPRAHLAHYSLGLALQRQGRLDKAIAAYREAIRLKKDYPEANYNLGNALERQGRLDEAIAAYREAVRLKKDYPEAHNNLGSTLADQGRLDEAIAEYRLAVASRQDFPEAHLAHYGLGRALADQSRLDGAIAAYRQAIRLKNDYPEAHFNLGLALKRQGRLDGAIAAYRQAIRLKKDYPEAHCNLALALQRQGRLDEAIAEYRLAVASRQEFPEAHLAHYGLGGTLKRKGRLDEAIAEFREAIRLKKDYPEAHNNLGAALENQGRLDEAIAEYRLAVASRQDFPEAHLAHENLGNALRRKGRLDDAIAEYREAIGLKKDWAIPHFDLGIAFGQKGLLDEAIAAYREALRIKPEYPEAHCNLGFALQQQGEFQQALIEVRRAQELGATDPHWIPVSPRWFRHCERLVELDARLSGYLAGTTTPTSPRERIELGELCKLKHLNHAAVRFYAEAFAGQPKLPDAQRGRHRYNAACAAGLAAAGQGKDADNLDTRERARLRRQALDWLRADLAQWVKQMENGSHGVRTRVQGTLAHWQQDRDLASVRGTVALAKLPADEQPGWRRLWADVEKTLAQAQQESKRPGNSAKKR
jgi:serine/threonine-protein kinase